MAHTKSLADWPSDLRRFQRRDSATLKAVINSTCAEGRWMRTERFEPTPAWEHALNELQCPCHLLLLACDEERPVGWCRLFPLDAPGTVEVGIGLLAPYRNRGLGTHMLQRALGWARQQNLDRLTLTVRFDNHRAIHVFKKCGFSFTGHHDQRWIEMEHILGAETGSEETFL